MSGLINISAFTLLKKIGSGSYADVYKVIQKNTGITFAAKVMKKKYDKLTKDERQNLKREIDIMIKLKHESVVKFIGFSPFNFKRKRYPVIILEYLPNKTLKEILNLEKISNSPEGWDGTKKLINMYGIASAMSYLHANDIIHRDLKPDNILMDEYLFPKIADFGLSKFKDTDQTQQYRGTPIYSAPEVFETYSYSFAIDVYSYGIIIYEIITNQRPFPKGIALTELVAKLTMGERPIIDSSVSEPYRKLIERCWAQNPEERPTFNEIVTLLEEDEGFITSTVDRGEYINYIDYVKMAQTEGNALLNFSPVSIYRTTDNTQRNANKEEAEEEEEDLFEERDDFLQENNIYDKEEIAQFYKNSADKGNLYAMVKYGELLFNGEGVPENKEDAVEYFKMVSDYGNIEGMVQYSIALFNGEGVAQNKSAAIKFFKKASYKGNTKAMLKYADSLLNGDGCPQNKEKAVAFYKRAADKGELEAIIKYADLLNKGTAQEKQKAIKMYEKAADKGDVESMFRYAEFLYFGVGVPVNKTEAARYFKMAADFGHLKSIFRIAYMLSEGDGIKKDIRESCHYYKIVSDKGDLLAKNNYAVLLLQIEDTRFRDEDIYNYDDMDKPKIAIDCLKYAADRGCLDAINNWANLHYFGKYISKNKEKAVELYKYAADKGHADAINNYANLLMNGDGIPMDKERATQLYKIAADKGNQFAAYNYALILTKSGSSSRDEIKNYLKIAADKGHYHAEYLYGQYLLEEDEDKAMKYFKSKADKEHDELAFLYGKRICLGESNIAIMEEGIEYINKSSNQKNKRASILSEMIDYNKSCNIY